MPVARRTPTPTPSPAVSTHYPLFPMRIDPINKQLGRLVRTMVRQLREENSSTTEEEIVGILLANHFRWDGVKILEASAAALEVAGFDAECEVVRRMIAGVN